MFIVENSRSCRSYFPVDTVVTDAEVVVYADLSGVKKETIRLNVTNGVLKISAYREPLEGTRKTLERIYGKLEREFDITSLVYSKITAEYIDGILKVVIHRDVSESSVDITIG